MISAIRMCLALALAGVASLAQAEFHNFRIEQIYTNADGSVQFVVLKECCNANGENILDGKSLRSTSPAGTQTFTFPNDLPFNTANKRVLVATPGFAALGLIAPDYTMPANFVPIGGGSLNYAGVSQVSFGPLPTDGTNAILATGAVVPNVATNFVGQSASVQPGPTSALAVEFYNATLDHYFLTHIANEISDLDTGVHPGWMRTQQSFRVFTSSSAQTSPVCRFYIPPASGDSHFYGRGTQECTETGQKFPTFVNEDSQFFHVILPAAGVCPAGTIPVYRVFNNRPGSANHRYTIDRNIRDLMVSQQHWIAEGDGPDLVVMCVPPTTTTVAPAPPPMSEPPEPPMPPPGYGGYP
jgi:hypothetical protein